MPAVRNLYSYQQLTRGAALIIEIKSIECQNVSLSRYSIIFYLGPTGLNKKSLSVRSRSINHYNILFYKIIQKIVVYYDCETTWYSINWIKNVVYKFRNCRISIKDSIDPGTYKKSVLDVELYMRVQLKY